MLAGIGWARKDDRADVMRLASVATSTVAGMELIISICALVVGAVSVGIAVWQGRISRQQLELAKDTERRTEDTLKEIRVATDETRRIVQDVKDNIDDRITKIIDSRIQSDQAKDENSSAMSQMFMQAIMQGMTQQKPDDGQK